MKFIVDPFIDSLPKDPSSSQSPRTVPHGFYSHVRPKKFHKPALIHINSALLKQLGTDLEDKDKQLLTQLLSGQEFPKNVQPFAMNYGGHQFGHWAGQLGDGRAIHLGTIEENNSHNTSTWQLQLKGAGPTPYSRTADGLAVLRSSIREYLCSEAMHALGVPTTRALSLVSSGDQVLRDVLYNGNAAYEPGAIVGRVAPNFIRFGSFELPAVRDQKEALKQLTTNTIQYFFPAIKATGKDRIIHFFNEVCTRTAQLIVEWQRVGFVHGVMNTDNMSILGLTIDYGPYGWLEPYDPDWTPNTTDAQHRRYRFGNQSSVGLWNLYQLANALYPLVEETAALEACLEQYKTTFENGYQAMMAQKLGLAILAKDTKYFIEIQQLIAKLEEVLVLTETDMTLFFRSLASWNISHQKQPDASEILGPLYQAFYSPEELKGTVLDAWKVWLGKYASLLQKQAQDPKERRTQMNATNPKYVLRNYMAQLVIEKAEKGDYSLLNTLYELLQHPYEEQEAHESWFTKRPDWAKNKVGSSQLSCSS